ncbi:MAG: HAMP domain-containing sensor histidine kinase [Gudongella sp.]|jgi:signal transduction histidine kinase|nr:HAMP domain-containing sensor histidine kinase [Gudongella sp.]
MKRQSDKMRLEENSKKMNFKLWQYFMILAASIMIVLWLLQIVFMSSFYKSMKIKEIERIGNSLYSEYGSDDFQEKLVATSFSKGIAINIIDENGSIIFPLDIFDLIRRPQFEANAFVDFLNQLYKSSGESVVYTTRNIRMNQDAIVYGAILKNETGSNYFLYISSILEPMDTTIIILKNQLLIITIISLLLAMLLSYFFSKKLSEPIISITNTAKSLSKGDYSIKFKKGDYKEIDDLADTLNLTTTELQKSEELKRDLIANVTHDFKTPLTVIKSYSEMVRDLTGENKEKRNQNLQTIIEETDKLEKLVDEMLNLSRVQSGLKVLEKIRFDLEELTLEVLARFKYFSIEKGFNFTIKTEGQVYITADRTLISQVIYNLIANAINYSEGNKEIEIDIIEKVDKVCFSIKDYGVGIAEEDINYIWDRYYRGGKKHQRLQVGTGLGLSFVKSIILAHGGEVGVESQLGQESIFYFII